MADTGMQAVAISTLTASLVSPPTIPTWFHPVTAPPPSSTTTTTTTPGTIDADFAEFLNNLQLDALDYDSPRKPPSSYSAIPWENQDEMDALMQQWLRLENLPPPWVLFVGFMHLASILTIALVSERPPKHRVSPRDPPPPHPADQEP